MTFFGDAYGNVFLGHESWRVPHQDPCTSKFGEMNKFITKFNGIYNNLLTQRKNGKCDEQILETAL